MKLPFRGRYMPCARRAALRKRGNDMNQIGSMFLVGTMGILGGIPTLYILISLPVILVQKIFGKIKYGKSLYQ